MREDLTIVCMLWSDWGDGLGVGYVNRLFSAVEANLTIPHRFVCFTDKHPNHFRRSMFGGMEIFPMNVPDWRWNLRKLILYKPDNGLRGRVLAFDLDVVITGCLNEIASDKSKFITCEAAYHKGKVGGSLIGFDADDMGLRDILWPDWSEETRQHIEQVTGGSERKYLALQFDKNNFKPDFWQDKLPGQVVSYKVDCQNGVPEGARVVRFHGSPRPHEVGGVYWS